MERVKAAQSPYCCLQRSKGRYWLPKTWVQINAEVLKSRPTGVDRVPTHMQSADVPRLQERGMPFLGSDVRKISPRGLKPRLMWVLLIVRWFEGLEWMFFQ